MSGDKKSFHVQAFKQTDTGRRPNNEDYVLFFEPIDAQERSKSGCIYIVADGVGGSEKGERASKYASEKVLYEYLKHPDVEPGKRLKQVMTQANRDIFNYAEDNDIRMATTMTVAVIFGNSLIVANVGDSRIYLIRGKEAKQITEDHSIVGELVKNGDMTEIEAMKSKVKNRITRSIGGNAEVLVDIFGPIPLESNDRVVLCSDGLTRYATKQDIEKIASAGDTEKITNKLISLAKNRGRGGADNISVITVVYESLADWEMAKTDIGDEQPKILWNFNLILRSLLVTFCGAVFGVLIFYFSDLSSVLTRINEQAAPSSIPTATLSMPTSTMTSTSTSTNTLTVTPISLLTTTPQVIDQKTDTPVNSTVIATAPFYVNCIYIVQSGDYLSRISEKFGIGNDYKKILCDPNSINCNLNNPANVQPGWRVVIPNVVDALCKENGGQTQ